METLSFTLGILSVIIVAFVAVLVWGVVKVVKQQKQIKIMNDDFERTISDLYRNLSDNENRVYQRLNDMDRNAHERLKDLEKSLEAKEENLHRRIDEAYRQIYQSIEDQSTNLTNQYKSYTDSRIDKLIDTYFEMKGITSKKQVLKG